MTICRKCGTSNKDEQKFCSFCHELLIEDPEELAKREKQAKKKAQKAEKKQKRKLWRWKNALLLLIPINAIIHAVAGEAANGVNAVLGVDHAIVLIVLSVALTCIGGLIPSKKAAKKDPVTALRTE